MGLILPIYRLAENMKVRYPLEIRKVVPNSTLECSYITYVL